MRLLVINGPNLNLLGKRDKEHYGSVTLAALEESLVKAGQELGAELVFFQSNHEGALIDFIQREAASSHGILINAGALSHYSYSLRDALVDSRLPVVEIHLSNVYAREEWRRRSVIAEVTIGQISGFKVDSYRLGLQALVHHIGSRSA